MTLHLETILVLLVYMHSKILLQQFYSVLFCVCFFFYYYYLLVFFLWFSCFVFVLFVLFCFVLFFERVYVSNDVLNSLERNSEKLKTPITTKKRNQEKDKTIQNTTIGRKFEILCNFLSGYYTYKECVLMIADDTVNLSPVLCFCASFMKRMH